MSSLVAAFPPCQYRTPRSDAKDERRVPRDRELNGPQNLRLVTAKRKLRRKTASDCTGYRVGQYRTSMQHNSSPGRGSGVKA
eukprot:3059778-Rhodomonas_salina.1